MDRKHFDSKKIRQITSNLTKPEITLFNIALEEYYDLFPKIMNLKKKEFLPTLEKYIIITLQPRNINYSQETINKILSIIEENFYEPEYLKVNKLFRSINKIENCEKFHSKNFIPHCNKTTKAIHTCNEELYILDEGKYLLCLNCKLIYHSENILLKCDVCDLEYYSGIDIQNNIDNPNLKPATWAKYHCNAVINDVMKCNCKNIFYLNLETNKLVCLNCKNEIDPNNIKWNCIICQEDFISEAKIYNPFEFKIMKMAVKETLFKGIDARPERVPCCDIKPEEITNYVFHHKKQCEGKLYLGNLNKKKIVVCSKCHMLNFYDCHSWMCPLCKERFRLRDNKKKNTVKKKQIGSLVNKLINKKEKNKIRSESKNNDTSAENRENKRKNSQIIRYDKENIEFYDDEEGNKKNNNIKYIKNSNFKDALRKNSLEDYRNKKENSSCKVLKHKKNINNDFSIKNEEDNNNNKNKKDLNKINLEDGYSGRFLKKRDQSSNNIKSVKTGFAGIHIRNIKKYSPVKKYQNSGDVNLDNDNFKLEDDIKKSPKVVYNFNLNVNNNNNVFNIYKPNNNNNDNGSSTALNKIPVPNKSKGKYDSPKIIPKSNELEENSTINTNSNTNNNSISNREKPIEFLKDFKNESYTIIKQIGQGAFGKIYKVEDENGKFFAMKKILANSLDEISALEKEYNLVLSLAPLKLNLINIYGMETKQLDRTTYGMYVLMELAVRDWEREINLRKNKNRFYSEDNLITILKELAKTFSELQKNNISHRDIKPQNILLFSNGTFKIADFGEAKELMYLNRQTMRQTIRGTELYMSPILFEALKNNERTTKYIKHNTFKSDVFSLGLCFLFASSLTLNALFEVREITDINKLRSVVEKYLNNKYSEKFINILVYMLTIEEKERGDFFDLEEKTRNL